MCGGCRRKGVVSGIQEIWKKLLNLAKHLLCMDLTEIETISQGNLEIMNPVSAEKLLQAGRTAALGPGKKVLDIGCGNGTCLALWHNAFGISGCGVEQRATSAARARNTLAGTSIEIRCVDAAALVPAEPYNVVTALGSSFIFGGA